MFYKVLGALTWKAIRLYLRQKLPTKAVAALIVVAGIAAVAVAGRLRDGDGQ